MVKSTAEHFKPGMLKNEKKKDITFNFLALQEGPHCLGGQSGSAYSQEISTPWYLRSCNKNKRRKPLYMTYWIRKRAAIAKVIMLRDKIYRSSGTLIGAEFTEAFERLQFLLQLLRHRGVDTS